MIRNMADLENTVNKYLIKALELTRKEKRILEWAKRLKTEPVSNNTPPESVLINQIYQEANHG